MPTLYLGPLFALVTTIIAIASPPPSTSPHPGASAKATGAPSKYDALEPNQLFVAIRDTFRSHRPPPPYETYTLERKQLTSQGFPDYADSYKTEYWVRNLDRAALTRKVYRSINRGEMIFDRPAFNEARDPGPPTADVFEPAPVKSHPVSFVPTPEPERTALQTIGSTTVRTLFDYRVDSVVKEGDEYHLTVLPIRDTDRNRLRELFVDRQTLEIHKIVATDKLFILGSSDVYGVTFTITMGSLEGIPVVTAIHGVVGDGYSDDGAVVDYTFTKIAFPKDLPAWYFDPKQYAQNEKNEPL
jgi:hypothetical protein